MAKRITYYPHTATPEITSIFIDGRKKGYLQDRTKEEGRAYLHMGDYCRASGNLIGASVTHSCGSVAAAKRLASQLTHYERHTED